MSADEPTGDRSTIGSPSRWHRGSVILGGLAGVTVTAFGLAAIHGILSPVILTLILVICASPVRTWLLQRGVPGGLATGSVIVVVFGLLAGFVAVFLLAAGQFVAMLPSYSTQFQAMVASAGKWLASVGIGKSQIEAAEKSLDPSQLAGAASGLLGSVFSLVGALVIVLTMMILMAADAVYSGTILQQLAVRRPNLVEALVAYTVNVRRYMVVTAVLGVVQGVLNSVALALMHVPAALLWGLLSFLCSFIPNIGYFFAIAPPLVLGYLVGGWPVVIAVVVVYGVINAVVQSIVQPRVVGHAVSLSQTLTFFSVLFWAVVLGPVGAVFAIPLTLFGKAVLIDADPEAHWWRPVLGPTTETRALLKQGETARRDDRRRRRAGPAAKP